MLCEPGDSLYGGTRTYAKSISRMNSQRIGQDPVAAAARCFPLFRKNCAESIRIVVRRGRTCRSFITYRFGFLRAQFAPSTAIELLRSNN